MILSVLRYRHWRKRLRSWIMMWMYKIFWVQGLWLLLRNLSVGWFCFNKYLNCRLLFHFPLQLTNSWGIKYFTRIYRQPQWSVNFNNTCISVCCLLIISWQDMANQVRLLQNQLAEVQERLRYISEASCYNLLPFSSFLESHVHLWIMFLLSSWWLSLVK